MPLFNLFKKYVPPTSLPPLQMSELIRLRYQLRSLLGIIWYCSGHSSLRSLAFCRIHWSYRHPKQHTVSGCLSSGVLCKLRCIFLPKNQLSDLSVPTSSLPSSPTWPHICTCPAFGPTAAKSASYPTAGALVSAPAPTTATNCLRGQLSLP